VLAFGQQRRLTSNHLTAVSYDYKAKRSVTLNIPGNRPGGGQNALLEATMTPASMPGPMPAKPNATAVSP
jgi:hypothetical protein